MSATFADVVAELARADRELDEARTHLENISAMHSGAVSRGVLTQVLQRRLDDAKESFSLAATLHSIQVKTLLVKYGAEAFEMKRQAKVAELAESKPFVTERDDWRPPVMNAEEL